MSSMEDVARVIVSGESTGIENIDLSEIDFVTPKITYVYFNEDKEVYKIENFGQIFNSENFNNLHAPFCNLHTLIYNNPRGVIDDGAFANSALREARISCGDIYRKAFYGSKYLKKVDLEGTKIIGARAFEETGIDELVVPNSLKVLHVCSTKPVIAFKNFENALPTSNVKIEFEGLFRVDEYLMENGFVNFKNLVVYDPEICFPFLRDKAFSTNQTKELKKAGIEYFRRRVNDSTLSEDEILDDIELYHKFDRLIDGCLDQSPVEKYRNELNKASTQTEGKDNK